jgi:hypothetical protein
MFSEYQSEHPEMEPILWPVLLAAQNGTLSSEPEFQHLLTSENLSYKLDFNPDDPLDPHGSVWDTIIGAAAAHRHLNQIPRDVLAMLATEILDEEGTTVLHTAARTGCLDQLPESALSEGNLFRSFDSWGRSPALLAIESGFFRHIPIKLRKTEYLAQPISLGWTIFHSAAEAGFLDGIPKHFLTVRTMSLQTYEGITPLHLAARHCHLSQVPAKAFTLETLKVRECNGNTPLHLASGTRDGLGYVPSSLLCEETLLQKNGQGETVLHILWREGDPVCIDGSIYSPEVLALEGRGGMTLLNYVIERNRPELIPKERLEAGRALRDERELQRQLAECERAGEEMGGQSAGAPSSEREC